MNFLLKFVYRFLERSNSFKLFNGLTGVIDANVLEDGKRFEDIAQEDLDIL